MTLSKREKTIVIVTCAVLGLLALDHFILSPFLDSRNLLAGQRQTLERQLADAKQTIATSQAVHRRWSQFRAAGLQTDASATENNLLTEIRKWSVEARLPLASLRPDRGSSDQGLQEMTFQASAQGTMRAISAFVFRAETTLLPMRIRELQIASRTEGVDDLTLQLRISTLWDDTTFRPVTPVVAPLKKGTN